VVREKMARIVARATLSARLKFSAVMVQRVIEASFQIDRLRGV
jgi:hypothetical protein